MTIELRHGDCMEYMRGLPDKAFDLAIVDPPYGIHDKMIRKGATKRTGTFFKMYESGGWRDERPSSEYFDELFRVSANQVIWGANYFDMPPCRGFIFWDKLQPVDNFSAGEFAWTSFDVPARAFRHMYTNVAGRDVQRIHPTQKPIKLYDWILKNYAKPGQRILDTHLGSGSSAIAAFYFGCDFVGIEIDPDYYKAACERFDAETKQHAMELAV